MSEPKHISTPKSCPLLGAHFLRIETRVRGLQVASPQMSGPTTVSCLAKGCEWWDESLSCCTYVVHSAIMHQIDDALTNLQGALRDLIDVIKKEGR